MWLFDGEAGGFVGISNLGDGTAVGCLQAVSADKGCVHVEDLLLSGRAFGVDQLALCQTAVDPPKNTTSCCRWARWAARSRRCLALLGALDALVPRLLLASTQQRLVTGGIVA